MHRIPRSSRTRSVPRQTKDSISKNNDKGNDNFSINFTRDNRTKNIQPEEEISTKNEYSNVNVTIKSSWQSSSVNQSQRRNKGENSQRRQLLPPKFQSDLSSSTNQSNRDFGRTDTIENTNKTKELNSSISRTGIRSSHRRSASETRQFRSKVTISANSNMEKEKTDDMKEKVDKIKEKVDRLIEKVDDVNEKNIANKRPALGPPKRKNTMSEFRTENGVPKRISFRQKYEIENGDEDESIAAKQNETNRIKNQNNNVKRTTPKENGINRIRNHNNGKEPNHYESIIQSEKEKYDNNFSNYRQSYSTSSSKRRSASETRQTRRNNDISYQINESNQNPIPTQNQQKSTLRGKYEKASKMTEYDNIMKLNKEEKPKQSENPNYIPFNRTGRGPKPTATEPTIKMSVIPSSKANSGKDDTGNKRLSNFDLNDDFEISITTNNRSVFRSSSERRSQSASRQSNRIRFDEYKNQDGSPKKLTLSSLQKREQTEKPNNIKQTNSVQQKPINRQQINSYENKFNEMLTPKKDDFSSNLKKKIDEVSSNNFNDSENYSRNMRPQIRKKNRPFNRIDHDLKVDFNNNSKNDFISQNEKSRNSESNVEVNWNSNREKIRTNEKNSERLRKPIENNQNATTVNIPKYDVSNVNNPQMNQTVEEKPHVTFIGDFKMPPKKLKEPEIIIFKNDKGNEPNLQTFKEPIDFSHKLRHIPPDYFQKKLQENELEEFLEIENESKDEDDDEKKTIPNFQKIYKILQAKLESSSYREVIRLMNKNKRKHFVICLSRPLLDITGVYLLRGDLRFCTLLWGSGPKKITKNNIDIFWRYNVTTSSFEDDQKYDFVPNCDAVSLLKNS